MIVDTSALIAVMQGEPDAGSLINAILGASAVGMGAPSLAEAALVLSARLSRDASDLVSRVVDEFEIETIPFGVLHWKVAVAAFTRFGKGRHPAKLNFGDCMAYAIARVADQPLLFVGDDFRQTDVRVA